MDVELRCVAFAFLTKNGASFQVNGQECGPVPLLVAFHKPKGVITTLSDDWDREDLSDVLPKSLLLK